MRFPPALHGQPSEVAPGFLLAARDDEREPPPAQSVEDAP